MSQDENAGPVKAPKACFEEPQQVSAKADYYDSFCSKMKDDLHYAAIEEKITAAITKVGLYRTAIQAAMSGTDGLVAARNKAETNMKYDMDSLLQNVQDVVNADPVNGIEHIVSLGISYRTREPYTREAIDIRHGKLSGSFDLLVKKPNGDFAVVWFYTKTPDIASSWIMADFSHNTHGYIESLERGTVYYFKARTSSSIDGKSDWTVVVDIVCN